MNHKVSSLTLISYSNKIHLIQFPTSLKSPTILPQNLFNIIFKICNGFKITPSNLLWWQHPPPILFPAIPSQYKWLNVMSLVYSQIHVVALPHSLWKTTTTENDAAGWYQQFIFRIWYLTFYALHFPLASASPWFRPPAVLFLYVLGTFYAATKRGLINLHKWCNLFYHSLSWFILTARASIHYETKINAFYTLFTKSHPPLALPPSLSVLIRNPVKLIWSNFLLVLWFIEFCFNKFSSPELE